MIKTLNINNKYYQVDVDGIDIPLAWVLRDLLGLSGKDRCFQNKHSESCMVHVNGYAVRSCTTPLSQVLMKKITTIEGLSENGTHPVEKAWKENCILSDGYCQTGHMMSVAALLNHRSHPSDEEISATLAGESCDCQSDPAAYKAVKRASDLMLK